jgi:hypothetical protein
LADDAYAKLDPEQQAPACVQSLAPQALGRMASDFCLEQFRREQAKIERRISKGKWN